MLRKSKDPTRPRRAEATMIHVAVTPEQRRRCNTVAAHEDMSVSDLFRVIFVAEVDRRYAALGLEAGKGKGRPA